MEDMAMELMDFASLGRPPISFGRMFSLRESKGLLEPADDYPPCNIEKTGQDSYRIVLAVAGFGSDDLDITVQPNFLTVSGRKTGSAARGEARFHDSIIQRPFRRVFPLGDYVQVTGAQLTDGLLIINLVHDLPEAMRPRRIEIADGPGRRRSARHGWNKLYSANPSCGA
jgi:molecular chaperone IbpA